MTLFNATVSAGAAACAEIAFRRTGRPRPTCAPRAFSACPCVCLIQSETLASHCGQETLRGWELNRYLRSAGLLGVQLEGAAWMLEWEAAAWATDDSSLHTSTPRAHLDANHDFKWPFDRPTALRICEDGGKKVIVIQDCSWGQLNPFSTSMRSPFPDARRHDQ
eukprot:scaffold7123_cov119-Isochrysis_galbana.AAC.1